MSGAQDIKNPAPFLASAGTRHTTNYRHKIPINQILQIKVKYIPNFAISQLSELEFFLQELGLLIPNYKTILGIEQDYTHSTWDISSMVDLFYMYSEEDWKQPQ